MPGLWKTLLVAFSLIGIGFTVGGATYSLTEIPQQVKANTAAIIENTRRIEASGSKLDRILSEVVLGNCLAEKLAQGLPYQMCQYKKVEDR